MTTFRIDVRDTLVPDEVAAIEERLYQFNVAATGIADGRELGIFAHDDEGGLTGALIGATWGGCREIRIPADAERRRGLGRTLMEAAEREARARGCVQVVLRTHDVQAPDFYRRLGYRASARCQATRAATPTSPC